MAAIREQLSLVDKFSQGFNKFISMAAKAAGSSKAAQAATASYESAVESTGAAMSQVAIPMKNYEAVANTLQKRLVGLEAQWAALMQEQERMAAAGQQNTAEFAKLDNQILSLAGKLDMTETQFAYINDQMAQAAQTTEEATDAVQEYTDSAENAAEATEGLAGELSQADLDRVVKDTQRAAEAQKQFAKATKSASRESENLTNKLKSVGKQSSALRGLDNQFKRFALTLFSVSRILNMLKDALEYSPESVQDSWNSLATTIKQGVFGGLISALQTIQPYLDALNAKLQSPAGQKFAAGMIMVGQIVGTAIGYLLSVVSMFVDFIGNNFTTVMVIAAAVLAVYAAQALIAAAAELAAAWPLLLIIGIILLVIVILRQMGVTWEEIFTGIGTIVGWFYAYFYNCFVQIWNFVASFGEFFATFLDDPANAIVHLIADMADQCLQTLERLAKAIDGLFGSNLAGVVSGWRSGIQDLANSLVGEKSVHYERKEMIDPGDAAKDISKIFGNLGKGLDDFDLNYDDFLKTVDVSGITVGSGSIGDSVGGSLGADVGDIKKEVQMSEEDLKSLVDMAERQYVNKINLTSKTPVITINGQNTGNTAEDRRALANTIRDIILDERAASSFKSIAQPT